MFILLFILIFIIIKYINRILYITENYFNKSYFYNKYIKQVKENNDFNSYSATKLKKERDDCNIKIAEECKLIEKKIQVEFSIIKKNSLSNKYKIINLINISLNNKINEIINNRIKEDYNKLLKSQLLKLMKYLI